jgi:hypothetical protein
MQFVTAAHELQRACARASGARRGVMSMTGGRPSNTAARDHTTTAKPRPNYSSLSRRSVFWYVRRSKHCHVTDTTTTCAAICAAAPHGIQVDCRNSDNKRQGSRQLLTYGTYRSEQVLTTAGERRYSSTSALGGGDAGVAVQAPRVQSVM